MSSRRIISRVLMSLAIVTLLVTSGLHALGYASISKLLTESRLPGFLAGATRGLWVELSVHLVALAALLLLAVARPWPGMEAVVFGAWGGLGAHAGKLGDA